LKAVANRPNYFHPDAVIEAETASAWFRSIAAQKLPTILVAIW
jgi:hypothetical protein